eukprot:TRINITY_DN15603_c0_g1_i1.p1 TRINITY_DN15603_c0_g1~~TRINITY_DN15603_c0_g1_i1.p1  ORF type:complete len:382 (+),score=84.43 TRINITY_DN15603_c0_g1_i1:40-1185(+)
MPATEEDRKEHVRVDVDLSRSGAVLLVIGLPAGADFGIDFHRWQVGPRFRGLRLIPPGVHCVSTSSGSAVASEASGKEKVGVRLGLGEDELHANHSCFFHWFESGGVVVRRWDSAVEQLVELEEDDCARYEQGVRRFEFDADLAPYPLDGLSDWQKATASLSRPLLDQIQPVRRTICPSQAPLPPTHQNEEEGGTSSVVVEGPVLERNRIFYTPIDVRGIPPGLTPEMVTLVGMDKSHLIGDMQRMERLLAEFEYAFLAFFLGHSWESFEHWKSLLQVFCSSETKLHMTEPEPWERFLRCLVQQMGKFPEDFFVADLTGGNCLAPLIRGFLELIHDAPYEAWKALEAEMRQLMEERFGVPMDPDCPDLEDEEGPQVVNLSG